MTKTPVRPRLIIEIFERNIRHIGRFPVNNKNNTIEENEAALSDNYYNTPIQITHIIQLDESAWAYFTQHLLTDYDWLSGIGGRFSDYKGPYSILELQMKGMIDLWTNQSYIRCALILCNSKEPLLVNPEGHNYAKNVGKVINYNEIKSTIKAIIAETIEQTQLT